MEKEQKWVSARPIVMMASLVTGSPDSLTHCLPTSPLPHWPCLQSWAISEGPFWCLPSSPCLQPSAALGRSHTLSCHTPCVREARVSWQSPQPEWFTQWPTPKALARVHSQNRERGEDRVGGAGAGAQYQLPQGAPDQQLGRPGERLGLGTHCCPEAACSGQSTAVPSWLVSSCCYDK